MGKDCAACFLKDFNGITVGHWDSFERYLSYVMLTKARKDIWNPDYRKTMEVESGCYVHRKDDAGVYVVMGRDFAVYNANDATQLCEEIVAKAAQLFHPQWINFLFFSGNTCFICADEKYKTDIVNYVASKQVEWTVPVTHEEYVGHRCRDLDDCKQTVAHVISCGKNIIAEWEQAAKDRPVRPQGAFFTKYFRLIDADRISLMEAVASMERTIVCVHNGGIYHRFGGFASTLYCYRTLEEAFDQRIWLHRSASIALTEPPPMECYQKLKPHTRVVLSSKIVSTTGYTPTSILVLTTKALLSVDIFGHTEVLSSFPVLGATQIETDSQGKIWYILDGTVFFHFGKTDFDKVLWIARCVEGMLILQVGLVSIVGLDGEEVIKSCQVPVCFTQACKTKDNDIWLFGERSTTHRLDPDGNLRVCDGLNYSRIHDDDASSKPRKLIGMMPDFRFLFFKTFGYLANSRMYSYNDVINLGCAEQVVLTFGGHLFKCGDRDIHIC